jgi:xanthine dehydrogenase YagR molybdenum-binding subunit
MADIQYSWPDRDSSKVIGGRQIRLDGMAKSTGAAKYTYDINLKNMLVARALGSPHAHCTIKSIDSSLAEKVPGVVHVHVLDHAKPGSEIRWQGELLVIVAAESEAAAMEGISKLRVEYEPLDVFVDEFNLEAAKKAGRTAKDGGKVQLEKEPGDDEDESTFADKELERLLKQSAHRVEGFYGIDAITHCCLEPHGATVYWDNDQLIAYLSTQNVSGTDEGFANDLKIPADKVDVRCQYVGGGFGSKFAPDYWGTAAARIAKATGRPVKLMLSRDQELKLGGNRPSAYLKVRLGADKDGVVTVWDSDHWSSPGADGPGVPQGVIPYVFTPKNYRRTVTKVTTNNGPARAWRAPNHPQGCAITQTAYDDMAAKMGISSYDLFLKNLGTDDSPGVAGAKPSVYAAELEIAARLIDWKAKWHPHGKGARRGDIVDGLGISLHTWGGGGHGSTCIVKIHPDGGVESFCGTQDIGTGTRTVCAMVLAETFGLNVDAIRVNYGSSRLPVSGPSGGSTTVGGVSESHRRAGQEALAKINEMVSAKLGVPAADLIAVDGRIQARGDAKKGVSWKEACGMLGMKPLEVTATFRPSPTKSPLSDTKVGGVQMAHVEVDTRTGLIRMKKFVAVQDMGLIVNRRLAESQIYGAVIMGIAYSLFEQRISDPASGAFLNADMSKYNLCRLGDIGEIVVEMYEPESERSRGVIGLGEPPVIGPGAAISNAVCNALGFRVPLLPMTPQRVLEAIKNNAGRA